ncbi:MAG: hypothetical protein C4346_18435 [Chloroflexota bacterium]
MVIEAEAAQITVSRGDHGWEPGNELPGFSGLGYMITLPDRGTVADRDVTLTSPELRFLVEFRAAGTYAISIRGWASDGASDSVWIGLDDDAEGRIMKVEGFELGAWSWSAPRPVLEIPQPGIHVIHVWMREDGLAIDQIALAPESPLSRTPAPNGDAVPQATGAGGVRTPVPSIVGDGTGGPAAGPNRT